MPPAQAATALLLRSVDYGDSDRIVTLFTREHGKLTCLAKGARSSRRRYAGLQPFCLLAVSLRRRGHELAHLDHLQASAFPPGLSTRLEGLAAGYVLLELCDRFEQPESPSPQAFDLLWASLGALAAGAQADWVRSSFALQLLGLAGLAPELTDCRACGRTWPFEPARLSPTHAGWLCPACGRGMAGELGLEEAEALRSAALGAPHRLNFSSAAEAAVDRLVEFHLGRSLRSLQALSGILSLERQ